MIPFSPTIILRHRRENLKKCSLRGLEDREDLLFFTYPRDTLPPLQASYLLLAIDAPPLTRADALSGLILLDGTWRLSQVMLHNRPQLIHLNQRSIPSHYRAAYPRRQPDCPEPERGLASVEALFLAYQILGRPTDGLLDHYYWREIFLAQNGLHLNRSVDKILL